MTRLERSAWKLRIACRVVLGVGIAIALALKAISGGQGPSSSGDWAIVAYECVLCVLIALQWDRVAAPMSIMLFLGGCAFALLQPTPCRCLGDVQLTRSGHLMLAGAMGLVATCYLVLALRENLSDRKAALSADA